MTHRGPFQLWTFCNSVMLILMFKRWLSKQGAAPTRVVMTEMYLSCWDIASPMAAYQLQYTGNTNMNPISQLNFVLCCSGEGFSPPPSPRREIQMTIQRNLLNILTFPKRCEMTMSGKAFVQPEIWTARLSKYLISKHPWTIETFQLPISRWMDVSLLFFSN